MSEENTNGAKKKCQIVNKRPENVRGETRETLALGEEFNRGREKIMEPNTASKLKDSKSNKLKDFINVAGPLGVSHFPVVLSHGKREILENMQNAARTDVDVSNR